MFHPGHTQSPCSTPLPGHRSTAFPPRALKWCPIANVPCHSPCSISLYINKCCQLTYLLLFFFACPCRGWYQILMRHHLESLQCHHIIIQYQWIAYKIVRILDPTIYLYFMYYYILSKLYITTIIIFSIGASCPKPSPNRPCANVPRHHLSVHLQPLPKQPLLFDRMEPS